MNSSAVRLRRSLTLLGLGLVLVGPLAGDLLAQRAADDPLSARTFRVRYRPLTDAADVVGPLLSNNGSLTLRPRLKLLVVQDHETVLDRVEALLASFDLPPRSVEVTLTLILGVDRREEDPERSPYNSDLTRDVRGILETLGDFIKWHDYELLGSRSITGVEGSSVTADLTDEYRVIFTVDSVDDRRRLVTFERIVLQRLRMDEQGQARPEELYSMAMPVKMDRLRLVGAASGPESKRALFLAVQVSER